MGSYVNGVYVPTDAELGWDGEVNDLLGALGRSYIDVTLAPFGAVADGVTDASGAIQAAIDVVKATGGTVYIPGGVYAITEPLRIGASGVATEGVVLQGSGGTAKTSGTGSGSTWLKYTGGSGTGPILDWYSSFGGEVNNIGFDGNNLANYGLQITHISGQTNQGLDKSIRSCSFINARTYNVLIGDDATSAKTGQVEGVNFFNCWFRQSTLSAHTVAHVRHVSTNALSNNMYGCRFAGDLTYPTYHVSVVSGQMGFYGCEGAGGCGAADFLLGSISGQEPGNIYVFGYESQGAALLRTDYSHTSSAGVRPTVLSGVYHGDSEGGTADSIVWGTGMTAVTDWAPLILTGVRTKYDIVLDGPLAKVFVNGVLFTDFSGHFTGVNGADVDSQLSGDWYTGEAGANTPHFFSQTPGAMKTGSSGTGDVPAATLYGAGALWFDTSLGKLIASDGAAWVSSPAWDKFESMAGTTYIDAGRSDHFITIFTSSPQTMQAPVNPVAGKAITLDIYNGTGGALTTTWNAVFKLAGAWVDPANTKRRTISFYYDGTNWVELCRAAADI